MKDRRLREVLSQAGIVAGVYSGDLQVASTIPFWNKQYYDLYTRVSALEQYFGLKYIPAKKPLEVIPAHYEKINDSRRNKAS